MVAKDFEVGDLVWAKMKGYPFWPARISSPPPGMDSKKAQHYVYFFGSKNYSWILDEKIEHHSEEMMQNHSSKKKYFGFQEGVEEIKKESKLAPKKTKLVPKIASDESPEKSTAKPKVVKSPKVSKEKDSNLNEIAVESKKAIVKNKTPKKRRISNEDEPDCSLAKSSKSSGNYSTLFESVLPSIGAVPVKVIPPYSPEKGEGKTGADNKESLIKHVKPSFKKIGFLGLGMMGRGIVRNLLNSGHHVTFWNRTLEKCDPVVREFKEAIKALTPAEVVKNSDITFCCVSDPHAVKTIVFGDHGVLKGYEGCIRGEKGYVEMTSIDADTSQGIAEAITDAGMKYLEAPIIGSRKRAENGSILILGSGDRKLFNDCETCFHAMSNHAYYISCDVGKSANINIITSMFLGTMYVALSEALSLTERVKLSQSDLLEILELRGFACAPLVEKGKAILERNFSPDTSLKHQQKDLNLALNLSNFCDQPMPVTTAANEVYKHAKLLGCADHDAAAVYQGSRY